MPGLHATLSASSAKRWMSCPPSARLEERLHGIFGEQSSPFAAEGTRAHAVGELKLLRAKGKLGDKDGINEFNYQERRKALGAISKEIDDCTDYYAELVTEKYITARKVSPDAKLFVEYRLDFGKWVPEGFGTADALIVSDATLEVCDYKHGKGVPVSAVDNPQARCYGLGAIAAFGDLYGFTHVRNTIIQPRLDSVTEETLGRVDLLDWATNELAPAAEQAWKGKGEFNPGDHCRFCAARAICSARAAKAMSIFKHGFDAPGVLPDEEIPNILPVLDVAEAWIKDIKDYALNQAKRGQQWQGYKLVRGKRPPRKWADEELCREQLLRAGYLPEQFEDTKLKTVTQLEKVLGKAAFDALLERQTTQGDGSLTLVPEDDKRVEYSSADADFSDLVEDSHYAG